MIYPYECTQCGYQEIAKPMAEASRGEYCPKCGCLLKRIFTPIPFTWSDGCRFYDKGGYGDNLILRHKD